MTNPIDNARSVLKSTTPTEADIESAISALERLASDAASRLDGLGEDRERALVNAGAKEVSTIDEKTRNERFVVEQSQALVGQLWRLQVDVAERDRLASARSGREAVDTLVAEAVAEMEKLPRAAMIFRKALAAIAKADQAAAQFMREFPNEDPIVTAEARVRYRPATRTVIDERRAWAWRRADGHLFVETGNHTVELERPPGKSLAGAEQHWNRDLLSEIEAGALPLRPGQVFRMLNGGGPIVAPVSVIRREIEVTAPTRPEPLAEALKLPPLRANEPSWDIGYSDPDRVLAALAAPPPAGPAPTVEIELVEIEESDKVLQLNQAVAA